MTAGLDSALALCGELREEIARTAGDHPDCLHYAKALLELLQLHRPVPDHGNTTRAVCDDCSTERSVPVDWPCDTVEIIRRGVAGQ